jgi:uncharacterized membrane protein
MLLLLSPTDTLHTALSQLAVASVSVRLGLPAWGEWTLVVVSLTGVTVALRPKEPVSNEIMFTHEPKSNVH